jgi:hypothetical protein
MAMIPCGWLIFLIYRPIKANARKKWEKNGLSNGMPETFMFRKVEENRLGRLGKKKEKVVLG